MKKLIAVCLLAGLVALAGCNSSQTASASYIGVEAARAAALKDAGETEGDFTNATLEDRDGTVYYDVEFTAGGTKYEYAVDALTGSIIEAKREGGDDRKRALPALPPPAAKRAPRAALPRRRAPRLLALRKAPASSQRRKPPTSPRSTLRSPIAPCSL